MEACQIQVLPDQVIDQIAAGEVIERPASVVKELVENALDAGARRITVEVDGGGRRLIRVLDDGSGMSEAEARMALVRHATSKLRALDDLTSLTTMGFRGEALPSIAAVSRLTLTSRRAGEGPVNPAIKIVVEGGRVMSAEETGAPVGTLVEVRDLLWNVPARLKFLKGESTEMGHVSEVMTRIAMAHPGVHVRLVNRGRTALEAPPSRNSGERVSALVGAAVAERMCRAHGGEAGVSVEAHLGAPELAQTTTRGLHFYVGRRWVRDRGLVQSVLLGYGELVPRGRYPNAVVFIELDGAEVDVNVHPQKLEVRFSDAQAVYAAVRHAIRDAVARAPWLGEGGRTWSALGAVAEQRPWSGGGRASEAAREYASRLSRSLFAWRADGTPPEGRPVPTETSTGFRKQEPGSGKSPTVEGGVERGVERPGSGFQLPDSGFRRPVDVRTEDTQDGFFSSLTFLGQLDLTYLLCERDGELVLVDQHAAHERVMFQKLVERHRARAIPRQQLLFPLTIELDRNLAAIAEESMAALESVGFEIEPFGDATGGQAAFALKSAPAELRAGEDPVALLRQLCAELAEHGGSRAVEDRLDSVFATLACHSAVRAGDPLSPPEVASLFSSLDAIDFRAHCPHGRPVLLRIRVDEIARRFGRS